MRMISKLVHSFWRRRKSADASAPIEHRIPTNSISPPLSTSAHAADFLALIRSFGLNGTIDSRTLCDVYRMWCRDTCVEPRPWNSVSCELRRLLGGHKSYKWIRDDDGGRHRIRVFRIEAYPASTKSAAELEHLPTEVKSGAHRPC